MTELVERPVVQDHLSLQDVVDDLATLLGRSVVINGPDYVPLAASAQGDEIDHLRAQSLLRRRTPEPARAYLESLGIEEARGPVTVPLDTFRGRERLAVPVRSDESLLGMLWLITGGLPPLSATDHAAVDAAVVLARQVLTGGPARADASERARVLASLLADEAGERRAALALAVQRGWVERGDRTVVRALRTDGRASGVRRTAFARSLAALHPPQHVIGVRDDVVLVLGRRHDRAGSDARIAEAAERRGVTLLGIGSSRLDPGADDVVDAVRSASTAARLSAALPELGRSVDIDDVGAWALLASMPVEPSVLPMASPAAAALRLQHDDTQLRTVETYLDVAGNVRRACELLHIHRTTLYYRLENMPEVVTRALEDGLQRSALHLALKLARLWDADARP